MNKTESALMMIEPTMAPTEPMLDELTAIARKVWERQTPSEKSYRGHHRCTGAGCRAFSDNRDHFVGGLLTNSLLVHYVESHRAEVPAVEIEKLLAVVA